MTVSTRPQGTERGSWVCLWQMLNEVDFKRALDFLWETVLVKQLLLAADLPATPAHHHSPSPWAGCFPSVRLGWAVASSPAKVVGCSQHGCWGHTCCCHQCALSGRLGSCKYGAASHAGELLPTPQDGEPWPRRLVGCRTMVGRTALYPPEGSIGKKMGVITKLFRLHLLNHQVLLQLRQREQGSPE